MPALSDSTPDDCSGPFAQFIRWGTEAYPAGPDGKHFSNQSSKYSIVYSTKSAGATHLLLLR